MQKLKLTKKYEKYPEYKDSGVEWIGKIPKGWSVATSRRLFITKKDRVGFEFGNYKILSLTLNGVIPKVLDGSGKNPAEYDTYQVFNKNDLVFCLFDYDVTPRTIGYVEENGMMTGAYTRLIPQKETFSRYYYYYFLSLDFSKELLHLCTGLRNSLSKPVFWSLLNPFPSADIQEKISDYLDQKISSINLIIEKKQKMIELLKEKRTAVINYAVTRGLDPKAELIESGVEWIGKIPKGWKLDKVKRVADVLPSNIDKLSVKEELLVRLCNYTDVYKNRSIVSGMIENLMIATATENQIRKLSLQKDDVIITKDSETPDDIGIPAYVPETLAGVVCGYHLAIIRPYKICGAYLNYFFLSKMAKTQFFMAANGLTRYALGIGDIGMTVVPLPSKNEQEKIACYLDEEIDTFDNAIHLAEKSIQILQEFKASLISSVVTGKIKV